MYYSYKLKELYMGATKDVLEILLDLGVAPGLNLVPVTTIANMVNTYSNKAVHTPRCVGRALVELGCTKRVKLVKGRQVVSYFINP